MAEYGFPFPAIDDDRMYDAADWAAYFAQFISNGVFPIGTQLQVTAGSGMQVNVSAGAAWINGYGRVFDTTYVLDIDPADGVLNRIDRVVVRWGRVERAIFLDVRKGTSASVPSAPALVRDADHYDLCLAEISIPAGITEITGAHISDKRLDTDLCGIVSSIITPDTAGWYEGWESEFTAWFSHIKELLADDPATELAAAVATLESEMDTAQADITELENTATAVITAGTAPDFTIPDTTVTAYAAGLRRTIIAHADSGANPTLNFNSLGAKSVYQATGKAAKWLAGQHVVVEYDGTNFFACSAGGGVELPAVPEAGSTVLYAILNNNEIKPPETTYAAAGAGWGITALKPCALRFTYSIASARTNGVYAKLQKNGVDVPSSEFYIVAGSSSSLTGRKSIDVSLAAGDVVKLWHRYSQGSAGGSYRDTTGFMASILASDLQDGIDDLIAPTTS